MSSSPNVPAVQKAWRAHNRGLPRDVITLDEIPVPQPKHGQALIKVEAVSLNPGSCKILRMIPNMFQKRPHVVEFDFSGTVVDPNDTSFKAGDKIWGTCDLMNAEGALSEYLVADEDHFAFRPEGLSVEQSSGLGVACLTAEQALFEIAGVQPGQHVMVVGGSSSVGGLTIQMLKQIGCTIYTSCSTKNIDFVKSLGADVVYDYTTAPLYQQVMANPPSPKFHAIIDSIGDWQFYNYSEHYLAPNAIFVCPGTMMQGPSDMLGDALAAMWAFRPRWLGGANRVYKNMRPATKSGKTRLNRVVDIVNKGSVAPVVDSVYKFDDVYAAYDRVMSQRARGKVVVNVV
ncbi:GroES-like protein [Clavulina sp. PMI_390]|nr:GroES-like protein [Clavulina sp. PMI_390]